MAQGKRAGLITPRSLDQNQSPVFTPIQGFSLHLFYRNRSSNWTKNVVTYYRLSSGAERQAHNLEVVGSKPTGGNHPIRVFRLFYRSNSFIHSFQATSTADVLSSDTYFTDYFIITVRKSDGYFLFITSTVWDRYLQVAIV